MAQLLGNVAVGSTVYLNEDGSPQAYLVVHQGLPGSMYDESCNGTWLLRRDIYSDGPWSLQNSNQYVTSTIVTSFMVNFPNKFDSDIKSVIKTVKIPYCVGNGSSQVNIGANGYSCKMFLLSLSELGITGGQNGIPAVGSKLTYFSGSDAQSRRAKISPYWSRDPHINNSNVVWSIANNGGGNTARADSPLGTIPAMVMPTNLIVDDSNNVTGISIPTISSITVPSLAMQSQSIPLSWTPVSVSGYTVTYQLQRNANNGGWTTIYTGADTSYTDTAGTWTQVQYQVAAVVEGTVGSYTQSTIIPVSNPNALVISGQDGNLGTLTSNLPYTVSSNTGNPISLTRTVNGAQIVTLTVDSGFAYSIPIADLPTGTGTIQITASVDNSGETVTATRTWTYYKTPINIPSTGGVAQLTQNGQNIWPTTIADAVQAPVYLGGNLNAALNKLGQAALYTKIGSPKYNQATVDLSKVSVGDEVLLPYNGVMVSHIVVHIGNPDPSMYDASCDGVWLLRKDCVAQGWWNNSGINTLSDSTIMATMQGYVANYDTTVRNAIQTVKIPYCVGGGNTTVNTLSNGLSCQIFPLSGYEVGFTQSDDLNMPIDGVKLSYFDEGNTANTESTNKRISSYNGKNFDYWLRTPYLGPSNEVSCGVTNFGKFVSASYYNSYGYRPCFIIQTNFSASYYIDVGNGIHPSQEYTQGGSITDVFGYDVPICQYEVGSYVGTGQYGSGNPNSLTFGFEPKLVCITREDENDYRAILPYLGYGLVWTSSAVGNSGFNAFGVGTGWSGNSVSWWNNYAAQQMNISGVTYQYMAIG